MTEQNRLSRFSETNGQDPSVAALPRDNSTALLERIVGPFQHVPAPEPRPATGFYTDTTVCIGAGSPMLT